MVSTVENESKLGFAQTHQGFAWWAGSAGICRVIRRSGERPLLAELRSAYDSWGGQRPPNAWTHRPLKRAALIY